MKEPKDLGIKIGTPEEVFWTDLKKKCEEMIAQCNHEIAIQEHILPFVNAKIDEEKAKMKS